MKHVTKRPEKPKHVTRRTHAGAQPGGRPAAPAVEADPTTDPERSLASAKGVEEEAKLLEEEKKKHASRAAGEPAGSSDTPMLPSQLPSITPPTKPIAATAAGGGGGGGGGDDSESSDEIPPERNDGDSTATASGPEEREEPNSADNTAREMWSEPPSWGQDYPSSPEGPPSASADENRSTKGEDEEMSALDMLRTGKASRLVRTGPGTPRKNVKDSFTQDEVEEAEKLMQENRGAFLRACIEQCIVNKDDSPEDLAKNLRNYPFRLSAFKR